MKKNLEVYASFQEDSNVGWVWIPPLDTIHSRDHIEVSQTNNSVICVARVIDKNFLYLYNKAPRNIITDENNAIIISEYYRDKLGGIKTGQKYDFEIKRICKLNFVSKTRALMQHPDNAVKIACWLALVSVGLSILGVVMSAIQMCR